MFPTQPTPPQPGQESVWDYPRPPRLEASAKKLEIVCQGIKIASTQRGQRVLETSHPPVYYFPPADIQMQYLQPTQRRSFCEWKGRAIYYNIVIEGLAITNAAWSYPEPTPTFAPIQDYIAFYPSLMDACYVDGELVTAQPGDFYGGWITKDIVGPFKGSPGTWGW